MSVFFRAKVVNGNGGAAISGASVTVRRATGETYSGTTDSGGHVVIAVDPYYTQYVDVLITKSGFLDYVGGGVYYDWDPSNVETTYSIHATADDTAGAGYGSTVAAADPVIVEELKVYGASVGNDAPPPPPFGFIGHVNIQAATVFARVRVWNSKGDNLENADFVVYTPDGNIHGKTDASGIVEITDSRATKVEVSLQCVATATYLIDWNTPLMTGGIIYNLILDPPPTISASPINSLNFLRWQSANNFIIPSLIEPEVISGDCDEDPLSYLRAPIVRDCPPYDLPTVYKDEINFFINSDEELDFSDFSDLKIGLISGGSLIAPEIGTLSRTSVASTYRIFGSVTIPAVAFGRYRLAIYRQTNKNVLLVSNTIRVANFDDWNNETVFLQYANAENVANYLFKSTPVGWLGSIRIDAKILNEQTPANMAEYEDMNFNTRLTRFTLEREVELGTLFLDSDTHAATAFALGFSTFKINGTNYRASAGYERENTDDYHLSRAKVKLKDQDFRRKIKYC